MDGQAQVQELSEDAIITARVNRLCVLKQLAWNETTEKTVKTVFLTAFQNLCAFSRVAQWKH